VATEPRTPGERPNRLPWPPLIYLGALLAGLLLAQARPLPWPAGAPAGVLLAAGVALIAGALAIDIAAMRTLQRAKTTVLPHRPSTALVTSGVFARSRNPIYLANSVLVAGAGLATGNAWYLLLALVAAFATDRLAIRREERHLQARFGGAYRAYCEQVPRWL